MTKEVRTHGLARAVSKEEILAAIRKCARKLGRIPTRVELRELGGVRSKRVERAFGSLRRAIIAAGLEPIGKGYEASRESLLKDWARVARKIGKLPTKNAYGQHGRYSSTPYDSRWRWWRDVAEEFRVFARKTKLEAEWGDVLQMIEADYPERENGQPAASRNAGRTQAEESPAAETAIEVKRRVLPGRAMYGQRMSLPGLGRAPINELGVIFVFALLAHELGFEVMRLQPDFPDCEALREVRPGKWQRVRIEFEFESRNFVEHRHDATKCDVIVCWRHNWAECPPKLEVIELGKEIGRSGDGVIG